MMVLDLFKRSSGSSAKALSRKQADILLSQTMQAARDPGLFGPPGVADDFQGRFDVVALVASLVSMRLTGLGESAHSLNQAYVNALFKSFDDALREEGVGDLTVPKKMQKLAESFYGRAAAYRAALELVAAGDASGDIALTEAVFRNVLRSNDNSKDMAARIAQHSLKLQDALAHATLDDLSNGAINWPSYGS